MYGSENGLATALARSEADASARLAAQMYSQGNAAAVARPFDSGVIISLGPGRYVNRAMCTESGFGVGTVGAVVKFFARRGLPASIQVPGWIDDDAIGELCSNGFAPDWTRSMLSVATETAVSAMSAMSSASSGEHAASELGVTTVTEGLMQSWLDVLAEGNDVPPAVRPISDELGRAAHSVVGSIDLLADVDQKPVACGSLQVIEGIGWLGGAATLPSSRGRGFQAALLRHRIVTASGLEVRLVAATAAPGSVSERNLIRAGLVQIDVQTVWTAMLSS